MSLSVAVRAVSALLLAAVPIVAAVGTTAGATAAEPLPMTTFETSGGAEWTSHEAELAFLSTVDAQSERLTLEVIGRTAEARPVHLARLGDPAPATAQQARSRPTALYVCSQHGNEPAGREACLIALRDLALAPSANDAALLQSSTVLFIPTANPDGRARNGRTNTEGVDINRDHLTLDSPEARAMAAIIRDYQPDISIDLHEYGPGQPLLYDDDVLYLWPRNLNVDDEVHDDAKALAEVTIAGASRAAGFTADEYGQTALVDTNVTQTAGGGDEGILRNAAGLRHALGILTETAVSANPAKPAELVAANNRLRRVNSDSVIIDSSLDYLRTNGDRAASVTAGARQRKTEEGRARSAPVFFAGQDEDTTVDGSGDPTVSAPAPGCYRLTPEQSTQVGPTLDLLDVQRRVLPTETYVSLTQPAEPYIPLVLDERGNRNAVNGEPLDACPGDVTEGPAPVVPEAPAAVALPLVALALVGGLAAVRRLRAHPVR